MTATIRLPPPEKQALNVVERTGQSAPPFSFDAVREHNLFAGLEFIEERLDKDGYLIDYGHGRGDILVKREAPLGRRRYTLAHELGHWILRQGAASKGLPPSVWKEIDHVELERWCERFAAALLVPAPWIQSYLRDHAPITTRHLLDHGPEHVFQVSRDAFLSRMFDVDRIVTVVRRTRDAAPPQTEIWPRFMRKQFDDQEIDSIGRALAGDAAWMGLGPDVDDGHVYASSRPRKGFRFLVAVVPA